MPHNSLFDAVMGRRAGNADTHRRWTDAMARVRRRRPVALRLARRFHAVATAAPLVAVVWVVTPAGPLFPLASACAGLISLRMALRARVTRELIRPDLLRERLRPSAVVPAVVLAATPAGESLARLWAAADPLTGVSGGLLLAAAALAGLYCPLVARTVRSRTARLLWTAPGLAFGRGSLLFLFGGLCLPRRALLVTTLFVLAAELLPALAATVADRSTLWRASWARLRGGSGAKHDEALASWAWDAVLSRPGRPDYRAVTALVRYAWQSYGGALTDQMPTALTEQRLQEGADQALDWLILADNALLAVEMNATAVPREDQEALLREHLTAHVLVQATAVLTWGFLDRPENAEEEARGAAEDFRLLGMPEWSALYGVCAAAVAARRGNNPNRAAAALCALIKERAAHGRDEGPWQYGAVLMTAMIAHHVDRKEQALVVLAELRRLAEVGPEGLEPTGLSPWAVGALWDAAVYDLNRYHVERDLREALGDMSPFHAVRSPTGTGMSEGSGKRLSAQVAPVPPGYGRVHPAALTPLTVAVLEHIVLTFGADQPWSKAERRRIDAQESMTTLVASVDALDDLHARITTRLDRRSATPVPRPSSDPMPSSDPTDELLRPSGRHVIAGETLRFILEHGTDPQAGLRKAFTYTEDMRAMKLSSDLALRTAGTDESGAPPRSPYRRVGGFDHRATYVLSSEAQSRTQTGSVGHTETYRLRGVLDFSQVHRMLATVGTGVLLVSYWHDEHETLLFLLRADSPAPQLVTVEHGTDGGAALERALQGIQPDDRERAPQPWDAPFRPLVEAVAAHSRPEETVWLVPDALLHHVPLHAVTLPDGRSLIERNPVCFTPSASLMRFCLTDTPQAAPASVLLIADRDSEHALAFASLEVRTVAARFPHTTTASGKRDLLDLLSARSHDVLHLACHGYFEPGLPGRSAVVLGRGEVLTASEVLGLNMRVGLVTIGACESGLGALPLAEERLGLVRAFLQAGARSVLAALWPVDDLSAGLLLEDFYTRLRDGTPRAVALRQAQLTLRTTTAQHVRRYCARHRSLLDDPAERAEVDEVLAQLEGLPEDRLVFDDPYHWAVFQLFGDWR
ncbi:CHAT domain-containing protein [Streptomyces vilmorinianum]|uniref:CHAT domain-containing protein n=1 Tax=Streptomyces vilmorinianum TaxID=3051092 RepID=UPI0010FBAED4|nr:CHAT domain-containing protein [Streptomyces vilmorinianum]